MSFILKELLNNPKMSPLKSQHGSLKMYIIKALIEKKKFWKNRKKQKDEELWLKCESSFGYQFVKRKITIQYLSTI